MTSFGGQDDSGGGDIGGLGYVLSGTGVGGYTNVLNDGGEADERCNIGVRANNMREPAINYRWIQAGLTSCTRMERQSRFQGRSTEGQRAQTREC